MNASGGQTVSPCVALPSCISWAGEMRPGKCSFTGSPQPRASVTMCRLGGGLPDVFFLEKGRVPRLFFLTDGPFVEPDDGSEKLPPLTRVTAVPGAGTACVRSGGYGYAGGRR